MYLFWNVKNELFLCLLIINIIVFTILIWFKNANQCRYLKQIFKNYIYSEGHNRIVWFSYNVHRFAESVDYFTVSVFLSSRW